MAKSRAQQASQGFLPLYGQSQGRRPFEVETGDAKIKPVASPTDPYTPVRHTPKSPMWDVAEALKSFESSLGPVIAKQKAEQAENDRIAGEAAFYQGTAPEQAEAVSSGLIPPFASPHFTNAYKEAEGRAHARTSLTNIASAYDAWEGKDADEDGSQFGAWFQNQVRSQLQGVTDPRVMRGILPALRQSQAMLHKRHLDYVADKAMQRGLAGVSSDVAGAIDSATAVPMISSATGKNRSYELVHKSIQGAIDHAASVGIPREAATGAAIDTVISQATARRDPDLLDSIPPEFAANPKVAAAIEKARDQINTRVHQDEQRADTILQKRRKELSDEAYRSALDLFAKDPNAELPPQLVDAGKEADPLFREKVESLRVKMQSHHQRVPDALQNEAQIRIHRSDDPIQQAIKEVEAGNIADPGRVSSALSAARQLERSRSFGQKSILSGSITAQYERSLKQYFTKSQIGGSATTDEAAYGRALTDYQIALTEWEQQNPNATAIERMKAQREIGEEMLKGLRGSGPSTPSQNVAPQPQSQAPAAPQQPVASVSPTVIAAAKAANPALQGMSDEQIAQRIQSQRQQPVSSPATVVAGSQGQAPAPQIGGANGAAPSAPAPAPAPAPVDVEQIKRQNPDLAHLPPAVLQEMAQRAQAKQQQQQQPTPAPAPAPVEKPQAEAQPAPQREASAPPTSIPPEAAEAAISYLKEQGVPDEILSAIPGLSRQEEPSVTPRLQRAQAAYEAARAKSETAREAPRFERIPGTPFSVPSRPAREPASSEPPRKNTYRGQTYTPRPGEKFEAEGLDIAYAAAPGAVYGKTATKNRKPIQALVFHHTAEPDSRDPVQSVKYGQTYDRQRGGSFGYHFYIDREGNIIQGAPLTARTNHLKDPSKAQRHTHRHITNENALSVSLIGTGKRPTPAQLKAAERLGEAIAKKFNIPGANIVGHGETQSDRESSEGRELARLLRSRKTTS